MAPRPSIQDIAAAANVSATTVSNVLGGRHKRMAPETHQRVLAAIESLDYRPSRIARQLRTGKSSILGLIVPSVENPFWGSWTHAVETEALRHGYQVFLCNSDRDTERERRYLEDLWDSGVRSVILASSLPSLDHVQSALNKGLQLIAFDRERQNDDPAGLINLSVDNKLGGYLATKHLLELGHRRIGFISGAIGTVNRQMRLEGYRKALTEVGIPFSNELVCAENDKGFGDYHSAELGRKGALALLSIPLRPTALVTVNDMFAFGAYAAIREKGMDQTDVSVVGFDDIILAQFFSPPLTSVRQPLEELAQLALEMVLRRERGEEAIEPTVLGTPTLVVRSSTFVSKNPMVGA